MIMSELEARGPGELILEREGVFHRWERPRFIPGGGGARAPVGNSSGAIFHCVDKDARLESRAPNYSGISAAATRRPSASSTL